MDTRQEQLQAWLKQVLNVSNISLNPVTGDASFRRYFRVDHKKTSLIAMDAPPKKEPCLPYIKIATALQNAGLNAPLILEKNTSEGFLLLSDLGDKLFLDEVSHDNADKLYKLALEKLLLMQQNVDTQNLELASFTDERLESELANCSKWFFQDFLELALTKKQLQIIDDTYQQLLENAKEQPEVFIHLDYHSRNLLLLPEDLGILDFQDAMIGPITYDLASLIRDCYINWPVVQVNQWALQYRRAAIEAKLMPDVSQECFLRWFDLTGMQRHLKASFIFARKYLRDQSTYYLNDLPRTLNYIINVSQRHLSLTPFYGFLKEHVRPKLKEKLKELG